MADTKHISYNKYEQKRKDKVQYLSQRFGKNQSETYKHCVDYVFSEINGKEKLSAKDLILC